MIRALAFALVVLTGGVQPAEIREAPELAARLAGLQTLYGGGEWFADNDGVPRGGAMLGSEADQWAKVQYLRLSGVIEPGDADKLRRFFEEPAYYRRYLVMDSPGGSFTEGLRLGEVLREFR